MLAEKKGSMIHKGDAVVTKSMLHSRWNSLALALYRALCGFDKGQTDGKYYAKEFCDRLGIFGSWKQEELGWRREVVKMMALLVATNHMTFLTTNLHNYAVRKLHGLVLTDDRFAAIKALKMADYNKVISAVTYGDKPETRKELITEIIARRSTTRNVWDAATKALVKAYTALKASTALPLGQRTEASKAVDKALGKLVSAVEGLHPGHAAWREAEVLRGIWRADVTIDNRNVSQMSERVYELLTFCRPIGRSLQALAEKAAKARKARVLIKGKPLPGMTDPRRKKRKWAFTLAPVMDIGPKFVPLTTTAMKALFEELAKVHPYLKKKLDETKAEMAKIDAQNEDMEGEEADIGDDVVDEAVGGDDVVDEAVGGDAVVDEAVGGDAGDANAKKVAKSFCVWSAMTNVDRALRKKFFKNPLQRRFGNFVMTDGVGVSLNVRRRKPKLECDRIDLVRDIGKQKRFVAQYNAPNGLVEQRAELINEVANAKAVKDDAATATAKLKAVRAKINEAVKPALEADALLIDLKEKLDNVKKALTPADPYMVSAALKEKLDVTYDRKTQTYKAKDGSVIKGIDPGLKAIGTAVGLAADGTFEKAVDMSSGELRYLTGEKQYTKKKTRRIKEGCPGWLECPSLKTDATSLKTDATMLGARPISGRPPLRPPHERTLNTCLPPSSRPGPCILVVLGTKRRAPWTLATQRCSLSPFRPIPHDVAIHDPSMTQGTRHPRDTRSSRPCRPIESLIWDVQVCVARHETVQTDHLTCLL